MTRDGKSYTYLPKGKRLLVTETSRLLTDKDRTALLLDNYDLGCVGMDTIAGRAAYVVEIAARGSDHPSKKLWIDRTNSTILRTDDYSASGDKRGSTEMNSVSFSTKINPRTFALPSAKSIHYVMLCKSGESADIFKGVGFPVAMPAYVPKGYKLEGYHLLYSTCSCGHRSAQLTYTDGLNVISVFQTPG
jgi:negative regulator of sigma E activity